MQTTEENIGYEFQLNGINAEVKFDNGLIHTVGENVKLNPDGTMSKLSSMLSSVGLADPAELNENGTSAKIALKLAAGKSDYSLEDDSGFFKMNIVTPANLKDITSGNPKINLTVGDYNAVGTAEIAGAGAYTLVVDGKNVANKEGGIVINNDDGSAIYIQPEKDFMLQQFGVDDDFNMIEIEPSNETGVVVYVKEKDSDVFTEKYFMRSYSDDAVDIGRIDRESGTTFTNYSSQKETFDTKGALEADTYFNQKKDNLNAAYTDANNNYIYMNKWYAEANAEANVNQ